MASSREYLDFILEQAERVEGLTFRAMMGEFILYVQGKIVGGIYDDRLLVKPTPAAKRLLPDAPRELPYEGAKAMLPVEHVDDREFLGALLTAVAADLPTPKKRY